MSKRKQGNRGAYRMRYASAIRDSRYPLDPHGKDHHVAGYKELRHVISQCTHEDLVCSGAWCERSAREGGRRRVDTQGAVAAANFNTCVDLMRASGILIPHAPKGMDNNTERYDFICAPCSNAARYDVGLHDALPINEANCNFRTHATGKAHANAVKSFFEPVWVGATQDDLAPHKQNAIWPVIHAFFKHIVHDQVVAQRARETAATRATVK